jgi:hypothetical protein
MMDACTINAPDADGVLDESTGQYTPAPGAQRYAGPCRVKVDATQDHQVDAAERMISQRSYVVSVPMSVVGVEVNDVVRVTASVLDPALATTRMRVVDVAKGSHLTARRLVCEEVTS